MKSFKILSLFFVLTFIGANISFAQSAGANMTEEQKEAFKKNMEEYVSSLNLTEDQKEAFKAINEKYATKMQAVKEGDGSRRKKMKQLKTINKDKNEEVKALLSDEQYEIYKEKTKEMQQKMKAQKKSKS